MKRILISAVSLAAVSVCAGKLDPEVAKNGKLYPDVAKKWYPHKLEKSSPRRFTGPFEAGEVDFYIVHHGGNLKVTLNAVRSKLKNGIVSRVEVPQAIFARFFDAEEFPVKKEYYVFPDGKGNKEKNIVTSYPKAPAGIYQVRCAVSQDSDIKVDIKTEPACSFGVAPSRSLMFPTSKGQFAESYLYTPVNCTKLKLYFYGSIGELYSLDGKLIKSATGNNTVIAEVNPGKIYKLKAINKWRGFAFAGAPAILCPDVATAKNIRGSVEFAPNGRLLYHKFQVRNWKWMHSLRKDQLTAPPVADLSKLRKEFLNNPGSEELVGQRGMLSYAKYMFDIQNLDPKSQDFGGTIGLAYLSGLWGIKGPFNPYYDNKNILNRFLLNVYYKFMKLQENGTFKADWNYYSGTDALGSLPTYMPFLLYGKKVPEKLRKPWCDTIAPLLDRFGMDRVGCENQTAHWLVDLECMYKGGAGKVYGDMARSFAKYLCSLEYNPFLKAGYLKENYAIDATYNGLSASNVSFYYVISGDPLAKEALKRIYDLFNHTVAQEPDGKLYGACGFSHRTTGSWCQRQWRGGTNFMQNELAGAGVWNKFGKPDESTETYLAKNLGWKPDADWYEKNERWIDHHAFAPWLDLWRSFLLRDTKVVEGQFPTAASDKFFKNADNKFYFVREPSYYAYAYVGKDWAESAKKQRKLIPYNKGWKQNGNILTPTTAKSKKGKWTAIQGLMMFWTPEYGNCILAKNWNIYTGQFVRAALRGGKVSWPDYWSVKSSYDDEKRALTISHRMINLPADVKRVITFGDKDLKIALTLTFTGNVDAVELVEQLPFLKKQGMKLDIKPDSAIFTNKAAKGVLLKFDHTVKTKTGLDSEHHQQTIGSLLIDLGTSHKKGETVKLNYSLSAI